jgi:hypothetical protein
MGRLALFKIICRARCTNLKLDTCSEAVPAHFDVLEFEKGCLYPLGPPMLSASKLKSMKCIAILHLVF